MLQSLDLTLPELYQTYVCIWECASSLPCHQFFHFFFSHFSRVYTAIMTAPQSMLSPLLPTACASLPSSCAPALPASRAPGLQAEAFLQSRGPSHHTLEAKGNQDSSAGSEPWRQCSSTAGFWRVRGVPIITFIHLSSAHLQAPPHYMHTHCTYTHAHALGTQSEHG